VSEWRICYVIYTSRANDWTHATYIVKNDRKFVQNFSNRIFCNWLSFYAIRVFPNMLARIHVYMFHVYSSVRLSRCVTLSAQNTELASAKGNLLTSFQIYFLKFTKHPVPVAEGSKASVCGHSSAEIVGTNPTGGMDVCLFWVLCVVK
jgi:hypothetical protein